MTKTTFTQRMLHAPLLEATGRQRHRMTVTLALAATILFGAILAANIVTTDYGFIPVGFGLESTAGTIFAGFALAARDAIQDTIGRTGVVAVIILGSIVSFAISAPAIALASFAAFLIGELSDLAVYTPIRERATLGDRRWAAAVLASNAVNVVVDTAVFLGIAFGLHAIGPAMPGQIVGKLYATVLYLIIGATAARLIRRRANTMAA